MSGVRNEYAQKVDAEMSAITAQVQAEWERLFAGKTYHCPGCHQRATFGAYINGWVHIEGCPHCDVTFVVNPQAQHGDPATISAYHGEMRKISYREPFLSVTADEFIRTYMA